MRSGSVYATVLALATATTAAPLISRQSVDQPQTIYFMTNGVDNEIVALNVDQNGQLSDGSLTCTGGRGASGFDLNINATAVTDTLFSQSAVTILDDMIFAVNAGCNTVSMLVMDPNDSTKLSTVGQPAGTLGEFPMSVTVNADAKQVCVANSGAKNGLACASFSREEGIGAMDTLRSFDLKQTTPPKGPPNTVSQCFFNDAGTAVLTTVKGDGTPDNVGFLSSFALQNGKVGTKEVRSSPKDTAVLFGSANIAGTSDVLTTDASFGAAILTVGQNGKATTKSTLKIANQKATCWAAISEVSGTGFVTDVGVNHVVEVDLKTGEEVTTLESNNGNPGLIDLAAGGNFLYALSPGNTTTDTAVTVFDVSGGPGSIKEVQNFKPAGLPRGLSMGMRVFSGL